MRLNYYYWVDAFPGGLLVPEGIILPVVGTVMVYEIHVLIY